MGPDDADEIHGCEVCAQDEGHCICLHTMKDWVNGWSLMVKVQVTQPRAPISSPEAFLMKGWYPVSKS